MLTLDEEVKASSARRWKIPRTSIAAPAMITAATTDPKKTRICIHRFLATALSMAPSSDALRYIKVPRAWPLVTTTRVNVIRCGAKRRYGRNIEMSLRHQLGAGEVAGTGVAGFGVVAGAGVAGQRFVTSTSENGT
jgi:hypothetical protein